MTDFHDPAKPPFECVWILLASRVLPPAALKVWLRSWPLDGSARGCHASAELLGTLTGLSARTVDDTRRWLAEIGLLERVTLGKYPGWKVRLPARCWPASRKPTFETVRELAEHLDEILGERLAALARREVESVRQTPSPGGDYESTSRRSTPVPPRDLVTSITRGASAGEGGRGERSLPPKGLKDQPLALPLMSVESGGQGEQVDSPQEQGERGMPAGASDPTWLAQKEAARRARGRIA